jgi:hypothetical protein
MNNAKQQIIQLFMNNVKDKEIKLDKKHCGSEGHWLEKQFGLAHNSRNEPDLLGYEMKKYSKKITFGDFSASEYLFSNNKDYINNYNKWSNDTVNITRNDFIRYFGKQNPKKHNRYSWSGACIPKYNIWNEYGQILEINENNDVCIYYSYSKDTRQNLKYDFLQKDKILIVYWKKEKLEHHINNKFNKNGFFICNNRNYSQFRSSSNKFWSELIIEEY